MLSFMRRIALAVAVLVAFVACGGDPEPTPTPAPTVRPTPGTGPSQSTVDAQRDGVPPEIAAFSFPRRVDERARLEADEGIWVISYTPKPPEARPEYAEILLLDTAESQIVRAYPLETVRPTWILLGSDAVYCGRAGDGGLPNSMVCRIDRKTFAPRVRIYTGELGSWIPSEHPHTWEVEGFYLEMEDLVLDDVALWSETKSEGWTRLDLNSLTIVERGTPGPSSAQAPAATAAPS